MSADDREPGRDERLSRLLASWEAPVVPDELDDRVVSAYRRQSGRAGSPWSWLFTSSIRVPVPLAVAVVVLLLVTAALALRPAVPPPTAVSPGSSEPVRAAQRAAPVVTGMSLAGFEPVSEITATVVQGGAP